ncbi:hypothetical protein EP10_003045 [Geobacillus icigianus]|uniref:Uncharacterized protein n=1 Tax=Geobacillus icigianus TaxID=1430331 RepID=A0ABU6BKF0_9BACL|nr:hypothetical protein [Geobacillus icigianus]
MHQNIEPYIFYIFQDMGSILRLVWASSLFIYEYTLMNKRE